MCAVSFGGLTRGLPAVRPAGRALLRSGAGSQPAAAAAPAAAMPFVTIAVQPGAAVAELPDLLAAALAARSGRAWAVWDQALVQKVAAEDGVPLEMFGRVEAATPSWVDDVLAGFFDVPDSMRVQQRLGAAVRQLAQAGQAVFVGHGSVFVTRQMPGAVRVRLVAPLEQRVRQVAGALGASQKQARTWIAKHEKARRAFLRRYWPAQSLTDPATFAVTLNTAAAPVEALVQAIVAVVPGEG